MNGRKRSFEIQVVPSPHQIRSDRSRSLARCYGNHRDTASKRIEYETMLSFYFLSTIYRDILAKNTWATSADALAIPCLTENVVDHNFFVF